MFNHANRKPLEDSNSLNKLLKLPCMGSHRLPIWFVVSEKSTVRYNESDIISFCVCGCPCLEGQLSLTVLQVSELPIAENPRSFAFVKVS